MFRTAARVPLTLVVQAAELTLPWPAADGLQG